MSRVDGEAPGGGPPTGGDGDATPLDKLEMEDVGVSMEGVEWE